MKKLFLITLVLINLLSCSDTKKIEKFFNDRNIEKLNNKIKKTNQYPEIYDSKNDNITPLLYAISKHDQDSINLYLETGASYTEHDIYERDSIDYACEYSNIQYLEYCIKTIPKTYWNSIDATGNLKVIKSLQILGRMELINELIKKIDNINWSDKNKKTLLMYVAQVNTNVIATKLLLDAGAKINEKNTNEWTAIMYACRYNPNPLVIEDLIMRGASIQPSSEGLTTIMLASCNNNTGVLLKLLEYTDDINATTSEGKTALMYAAEFSKQPAVLKLLLTYGNKDNHSVLTVDNNGLTALDYVEKNTILNKNSQILNELTDFMKSKINNDENIQPTQPQKIE